jgi:hypothetical protein
MCPCACLCVCVCNCVQEKLSAFGALVDNLKRLDESLPEDRQGVYQTLSIFDNLIEAKVRGCFGLLG